MDGLDALRKKYLDGILAASDEAGRAGLRLAAGGTARDVALKGRGAGPGGHHGVGGDGSGRGGLGGLGLSADGGDDREARRAEDVGECGVHGRWLG